MRRPFKLDLILIYLILDLILITYTIDLILDLEKEAEEEASQPGWASGSAGLSTLTQKYQYTNKCKIKTFSFLAKSPQITFFLFTWNEISIQRVPKRPLDQVGLKLDKTVHPAIRQLSAGHQGGSMNISPMALNLRLKV